MRHLLFSAVLACTSTSVLAELAGNYDLPIEQYNLSIITPLNNLNYKTAVHYLIENTQTNTKTREQAARGEGNQVLAKYDVLIDNLAYDPNQGIPAADLQQPGPIDFTQAEDTAQGWARMGEAAVPALNIALNGLTSGQASASWRTKYQVPGNGKRNVSLKFRIPEAYMDGRFEFSGKGPYQARVKVQLLVNGFPVWWSEADRVAPQAPNNASEYEIDIFGTNWAFDKATEKASGKWVTAAMGSYEAGQALDVTLVYFVEASVGRKCQYAAQMYACMGVTAGFKRDATTTMPSFSSSPYVPTVVVANP
jgi:hypothetical protein